MLGFLLGIEVVQVAEEFVEAVVGRQHVVAVTEMVLAELSGHVALRFEQCGNGRIFFLHAFGCTRQADLGQAGPDGGLSGDEGGAARGAGLLAVPVGEKRALFGDAVDVGCLVTHHSHVVRADVELPDIVTPDDKDIRFLGGCLCH